MKKLFLAASGLFASVPGLAVIIKGIGTPPEYGVLFGGVVEAFGALSLLVLYLNRRRLQRMSVSKVTRLAISLGAVSLISIIVYIGLFNYCVVVHPTHGTVYYPLWTSGRLATLVAREGGRLNALDAYGRSDVNKLVQAMPGAMLATTSVLLLVYQAIFTSLSLAFGVIGFHEKEGM